MAGNRKRANRSRSGESSADSRNLIGGGGIWPKPDARESGTDLMGGSGRQRPGLFFLGKKAVAPVEKQ